jgi:hypothetical protein
MTKDDSPVRIKTAKFGNGDIADVVSGYSGLSRSMAGHVSQNKIL